MFSEKIILDTPEAKSVAHRAITEAPPGTKVTFSTVTRGDLQSRKFHALCAELAREVKWNGASWTASQWKQMLITSLWGLDMIPSLKADGSYIPMRRSSAALSVQEMSDLIEFTLSVGAELGHVFTDPRPGDARSAA